MDSKLDSKHADGAANGGGGERWFNSASEKLYFLAAIALVCVWWFIALFQLIWSCVVEMQLLVEVIPSVLNGSSLAVSFVFALVFAVVSVICSRFRFAFIFVGMTVLSYAFRQVLVYLMFLDL